MALVKITGGIFSTIRRWVFDKKKVITPNPFKPTNKKTIIELNLDGDNLRDILYETHDPANGMINKIIDEVNNLIRRVTTNETEISGIKAQIGSKSQLGHIHASGMGPTGPSLSKKGGKLQRGGRTAPLVSNRVVGVPRTRAVPSRLISTRPISTGNCESEREMLQRLDGLPLEQIRDRLEAYLSNNEPCINVSDNFHDGGFIGHSHGCEGTCGDLMGTTLIDIFDIIAMIDIVVNETGYNPCADVNGDGVVNVLDIVHLVEEVLMLQPLPNLCPTGNSTCEGIIGCDNVCYNETEITFLPTSARFDKCGVCGGRDLNCNDCCGVYDQSNCDGTRACYESDFVEVVEHGDYQVVLGPLETTPCMWDWGDWECLYGSVL